VARIKKELSASKEIIDKKLGQDTLYLAFPYGKYNPRVLQLAVEAGYELGLSVTRGGNPFFADPLRLRRNQILKADMNSFSARLKTFYPTSLR
jgi:peptidoglycan/xylan/chitin deacetylase (PgdA/CDA1 family)